MVVNKSNSYWDQYGKLTMYVLGGVLVISTIVGFTVYNTIIEDEKEDRIIFEQGYLQACKDFYDGTKLRYKLVVEENGNEKKWVKND